MARRKTLMDEIREELGQDRELNAAFQRELAQLKLANQIAAVRKRAGLSQAQLAARIGTKQTGVARMERADYTGFRTRTLAKIAAATNCTLHVQLAPREHRGRFVAAGAR